MALKRHTPPDDPNLTQLAAVHSFDAIDGVLVCRTCGLQVYPCVDRRSYDTYASVTTNRLLTCKRIYPKIGYTNPKQRVHVVKKATSFLLVLNCGQPAVNFLSPKQKASLISQLDAHEHHTFKAVPAVPCKAFSSDIVSIHVPNTNWYIAADLLIISLKTWTDLRKYLGKLNDIEAFKPSTFSFTSEFGQTMKFGLLAELVDYTNDVLKVKKKGNATYLLDLVFGVRKAPKMTRINIKS